MSIAAQTASQLVADVQTALEWLADLDDATVRHRPTPDRWSIAEVMGHLVDSCSNNHHRMIRAQQVDALTFPNYEQKHWASANDYHHADWQELLSLWSSYNLQLARVIRKLPAEQLSTPCTITPYDPCSLEFLVTDYVEHMNHHLKIVRQRVEEN